MIKIQKTRCYQTGWILTKTTLDWTAHNLRRASLGNFPFFHRTADADRQFALLETTRIPLNTSVHRRHVSRRKPRSCCMNICSNNIKKGPLLRKIFIKKRKPSSPFFKRVNNIPVHSALYRKAKIWWARNTYASDVKTQYLPFLFPILITGFWW